MKWFLCLLLLGVGFFSLQQFQEIDTLKTSLKQSDETVADLKRQLQTSAQIRSSPGAPSYVPTQPLAPTPAPRPSWMNTTSDLDKTPAPHRR
jgi:hypothetical protein